MKRLTFAPLLLLLLPVAAWAQSPSSTYGNITTNATNCATTPAACVSLAFTSPSTGSVGIQVGGTYTGTLEFEASIDNGTTWTAISGTPLASTTTATSTTGTGTWRFSVGGLTNIRVRASAAVTGTALVVIKSASVAAGLSGGGGSPGGLDTQVQFNDGGVFGGATHLTYDKSQVPTPSSNAVTIGPAESNVAAPIRSWWAPTETLFTSNMTATVGQDQAVGVEASGDMSAVPGVTGIGIVTYAKPLVDQSGSGDVVALNVISNIDGTHNVGRLKGIFVQRNQNLGTADADSNYGIEIQTQSGISSFINAALHITNTGTGANDYAIKIDGGNSDLGPDTTTIGKLAKLTNYNATALTGDGVPYIVANDDQTGQGAALSAVSLIASVPATGMYEVTWVASVTTAGDVSSVLGGATGFQVIYTSPTDSVAKTSNPTTITAGTSAGNTTATTVGGTVVAYCKVGTALQYSFGYTSVNAGVMKYEIHVKAKALGN